MVTEPYISTVDDLDNSWKKWTQKFKLQNQ